MLYAQKYLYTYQAATRRWVPSQSTPTLSYITYYYYAPKTAGGGGKQSINYPLPTMRLDDPPPPPTHIPNT